MIYSVAWTESPAPLPPASHQGFRPIECLGSAHRVSKWLRFERNSSGAPMLLVDLVLLLVELDSLRDTESANTYRVDAEPS